MSEFKGQEQRLLEHLEALRPQKGKPYYGRIRDCHHYIILAGEHRHRLAVVRQEMILLELERRDDLRKEAAGAAAKESLEEYRRLEVSRAKRLSAALTLREAMHIKTPGCVEGLSAPFKMKAIVAKVLVEHGLGWSEVFNTSRKQRICDVRFEIWVGMREAGYSLAQIGRLFDKDHTTILSGIRSYNARRNKRDTGTA